jgi:hypothetical protein
VANLRDGLLKIMWGYAAPASRDKWHFIEIVELTSQSLYFNPLASPLVENFLVQYGNETYEWPTTTFSGRHI